MNFENTTRMDTTCMHFRKTFERFLKLISAVPSHCPRTLNPIHPQYRRNIPLLGY